MKDISDSKLRIVGNLPYNISSKIILWSVKNKDMIRDVHFMLQKEFGERLTSGPNKKSYGRLSIFTQLFFKVEELFDVSSDPDLRPENLSIADYISITRYIQN